MVIIKNFDDKKSNWLINSTFAFFPLSYIFGSLITNINFLLFCILGIFFLKSKIFTVKMDKYIKTIFIFFIIVFFSTFLSLIKYLYFDAYESNNIERLIKSIIFFRFFLFLIIVYLLNKFNYLNFKYFFITSSVFVLILSLDVIFQYIFGFDVLGYKSFGLRNGGFFGDEYVAGAYIQRFSLFSIFFLSFFLKNTKFINSLAFIFFISIVGLGIFVSGNRMPFFIFLFSLFIIFLFDIKIKKILLFSIFSLLILSVMTMSNNRDLKNYYHSYFSNAYDVFTIPVDYFKFNIRKKSITENQKVQKNIELSKPIFIQQAGFESAYRRVFLSAIDVWVKNKIFGNGIKSFRIDCLKLKNNSSININEDHNALKRNRLCSLHPHNYYLEILSETGLVGFFSIFSILLFLFVFLIKNRKLFKENSMKNLFLLASIILLFLEMFPLRSTGSFFTSLNSNYIMMLLAITSCRIKLLESKIQ